MIFELQNYEVILRFKYWKLVAEFGAVGVVVYVKGCS